MGNAYRSVLASGSPTPPTPTGTVYGFHIDSTVSDPSNAVTYIEDAVGMTPAHMDFTNHVFDYGSWENAFFMPKPCMLKYDGTVDYYLDPNDYSKKLDGTASDISDETYNGNAMMEWGQNGKKIWLKFEATSENLYSGNVYIADTKMDDDYNDFPFHNSNGESGDHFYTPIYNSSIFDGALRSLSGKTVVNKMTFPNIVKAARLNNKDNEPMWDIEMFGDIQLINMLLVLMSKSLNCRTSYGYGLAGGGTEALFNNYVTGVHNTKGLFYGNNLNSTTDANDTIKIFGMENYYGFVYKWIQGFGTNYGYSCVKLTYGKEDGSQREGYSISASENSPILDKFYHPNVTQPSAANGYLSQMRFNKTCLVPENLAGNSNTYYCGYFATNFGQTNYVSWFGGAWYKQNQFVGIFCFEHMGYSNSYWYLSASLSCKPVALE